MTASSKYDSSRSSRSQNNGSRRGSAIILQAALSKNLKKVKSDRALKEKEKKASQRRGSAILIQKALKKNIEKKRESNKQEKKRRDSAVLIAQFVKKNSGRQLNKKQSSRSGKVSPTNYARQAAKADSKRRGSALVIQQAWKQKKLSGKSDSAMFVPTASQRSGGSGDEAKKFYPSSSISAENMPPKVSNGCMSAAGGQGPSQILKKLWLGNREDSMNLKLLKSLGITHVLNATAQLDNCFEGQLKYLKINVKDKEGVHLEGYFDKCTEFIAEGVRGGGVLVHCIAGASRSVTFVLAYLMSSKGERLALRDAFNFVKARRTCAHPNASFCVQLAKYEQELHSGGSSITKAKEKIWSSYELNTLKKGVKNHIPSGKLKTDTGGCVIM
ncbi:hypothetical protein TrVE_jg9534 [Triparma verrucosa]|uniref:protein-tyrosine-phosphatase n=2 Tax=Triparma TaxID=722752 RepID=A0A9W7AG55_9STRA|nr:hypothetical protein TrST_g1401 [Triparma strigata]GMH97769.1 hypothetical protein TrVE_jg9534 [Triparma verrucosa]